MGVCGGLDRVNGDLHVTRGGVFEADWAGHAGDELAVNLALSGARADGSPTDQAGDVLRRDHVEELGSSGHAHFGEVKEQAAGLAEAVVDLEGLVEEGIVDQALPSNSSPGLLKVDAHDNAEVVGEFGDGGLEQSGILAGGLGVVNGARADENQEARIATIEDLGDLSAGVKNGGRGGFRDWVFFLKKDRRKNDFGP